MECVVWEGGEGLTYWRMGGGGGGIGDRGLLLGGAVVASWGDSVRGRSLRVLGGSGMSMSVGCSVCVSLKPALLKNLRS